MHKVTPTLFTVAQPNYSALCIGSMTHVHAQQALHDIYCHHLPPTLYHTACHLIHDVQRLHRPHLRSNRFSMSQDYAVHTFRIRRLANCRTAQYTSGIHVTNYDLKPVSNSRGTGWFSELPLVTKFTVTTLLRGRVQAVLCNTIWSTYFCYRATSVVN